MKGEQYNLLVQVREQVLRPEERGGGERVRPDDLRALGHGDVRLPRRRQGPQPLLRRQADPAHLPGKGRVSREEFIESVYTAGYLLVIIAYVTLIFNFLSDTVGINLLFKQAKSSKPADRKFFM